MTIIKLVSESEAKGEVKEVYDDIKSHYKLDFVPAIFQAWANEPETITRRWSKTKDFEKRLGMEQFHLIGLCTALTTGCEYCVSFHSRILQDQGYSLGKINFLTELIANMAASDLYAKGLQLKPDLIPTQDRFEETA